MSAHISIILFAEDIAHEKFIEALVRRIAREGGVLLDFRVRVARGGHGKVLAEFMDFQRECLKFKILGKPDLAVAAIDANCKGYQEARRSVEEKIEKDFQGRVVIACPSPHIERWYLADPDAIFRILGVRPNVGKTKCERDYYKQLLKNAAKKGETPSPLGGIELAPDIVQEMDLFKAGKMDGSFKHFHDDLQKAFKRFKGVNS